MKLVEVGFRANMNRKCNFIPKSPLPIASQMRQISFLWSFVLALSVSVSCIVRCWLSSTMVRLSSDNSSHPSEMTITHPKTTCGCPCGGYNENQKPNENRKQRNGHSLYPPTLWNAFDIVRLHNYNWWPPEWSVWERHNSNLSQDTVLLNIWDR